ncbi:hypothetical protein DFJ74DRAFT_646870 [Hyaloraphidium curvatum]|nr:hypothetical protein DFJ74DRAFT_646870 [Hyaloraphidium curvatum]
MPAVAANGNTESTAKDGDSVSLGNLDASPTSRQATPSAPVQLSGEDMLALFPWLPPPISSLEDGVPENAEFAAVRAANPLDPGSFLDALRASRSTVALELICRAVLRYGSWHFNIQTALVWSIWAALLGVAWWFSSSNSAPAFGTAQLAAMALTVWSGLAQLLILNAFWSRSRWQKVMTRSMSSPGASPLDIHPLAGYVRWHQLAAAKSTSLLLIHDPSDSSCPCPLPACVGNHLIKYAWYRIAVMLAISSVLFCFVFFQMYTTFISFSARFWAQWWSYILAALALSLGVSQIATTWPGLSTTSNAYSLDVARRLHRRAMKLAMQSLLARLRFALAHGDDAVLDEGDCELYARLHDELAATWRYRFPLLSHSGTVSLFWVVVFAINTVITASISQAVDLYTDARHAIAAMVVAAQSGPASGWKRDLVARMWGHDALLASFLDVSRYKGQFLGFTVDFGFTRSLLITVFTVIIGLVSILRGSGLFVSLDYVCPSR